MNTHTHTRTLLLTKGEPGSVALAVAVAVSVAVDRFLPTVYRIVSGCALVTASSNTLRPQSQTAGGHIDLLPQVENFLINFAELFNLI